MLRTFTFHTSIGYLVCVAYSMSFAYQLIAQTYPKDIIIHNCTVSL